MKNICEWLLLKIDQVYSNTRVPTRVRHESTQVDTSQHKSNTNQHESKTCLDHKKETNMVKRKDKTWLNGVVEDCIYQDLGFSLKFMTNWTIKHYFFYKSIYFIKRCVIIYSIFFQERSNIKWIPKMQGPETPGKKQKMI